MAERTATTSHLNGSLWVAAAAAGAFPSPSRACAASALKPGLALAQLLLRSHLTRAAERQITGYPTLRLLLAGLRLTCYHYSRAALPAAAPP